MKRLQELTGRESGAVLFENGDIILCNWAHIQGIPRLIENQIIGLGEELSGAIACTPPTAAIDALRQKGDEAVSVSFSAWKVAGVTIVTKNFRK